MKKERELFLEESLLLGESSPLVAHLGSASFGGCCGGWAYSLCEAFALRFRRNHKARTTLFKAYLSQGNIRVTDTDFVVFKAAQVQKKRTAEPKEDSQQNRSLKSRQATIPFTRPLRSPQHPRLLPPRHSLALSLPLSPACCGSLAHRSCQRLLVSLAPFLGLHLHCCTTAPFAAIAGEPPSTLRRGRGKIEGLAPTRSSASAKGRIQAPVW